MLSIICVPTPKCIWKILSDDAATRRETETERNAAQGEQVHVMTVVIRTARHGRRVRGTRDRENERAHSKTPDAGWRRQNEGRTSGLVVVKSSRGVGDVGQRV